MAENGKEALDSRELSAWLRTAEADPKRCFLCYRISVGNRGREGTLHPIRLAGMTLSREMQVSHIVHCRGGAKSLA